MKCLYLRWPFEDGFEAPTNEIDGPSNEWYKPRQEMEMGKHSAIKLSSSAKIEIQNFSKVEDRARLTQTALKAFVKLAGRWGMSNPESAALLGVSLSTWERIKRGERTEPLSQDQLTRVSALTGTFKGLHLLFADEMADRWPQLPNSGPLFENRRPIEAMIEGGIPRMLEVRRYIDAVRGGL